MLGLGLAVKAVANFALESFTESVQMGPYGHF